MSNHLTQYKNLQRQAELYYQEHTIDIRIECHSLQRSEILKSLPLLHDISIWCRKGGVSLEAALCKTLRCPYKETPEDIVRGCAECQCFQITTPSTSWSSARHLFEYGRASGELLER